MTSEKNRSNPLFPEGTPAENVVRAVLMMQQTRAERELKQVENLLARFPNTYTNKLVAAWERIKAEGGDDGEALCQLTQIIAADLEAGLPKTGG